jgi:internalin A
MRRLTKLSRFGLHGNAALGLPDEVLGPTWQEVARRKREAKPPAEILDYYFRTHLGPRRPLNELKVILVGQGSVGKTSLVKRIVYGTFNAQEEKTEGIYINKDWRVTGQDEHAGRVQVNFWDFGGQEIMHATHQFFLTKRTVYVLVLDARKGENESNIHYWLKIIRSYGGESPVLVVTNKCETHYLDLNETRLQKDYPSIRGFFRTSCETGMGIDELKAAIQDQIRGMPHVFDLLPMAYFTIKQELEQLAGRENYIDVRKYYALCHDHEVDERAQQDLLLRFLHDLGSVLSFNDPESPYSLREMSVLKPEWVTEGVYKILNHKELPRNGGVLTKADLPAILTGATHPHACHPYIIDMMHKFELSFTIRDGEKWLVAELLPAKEPRLDWDVGGSLNFQYHYEVLPPGIICRFIVRRYGNLTNDPIYWRSGVVLDFDGCQALVRSDTDKGRMYISVDGPENGRRGALAIIRDEFARIHATVPNLLPKQCVPLPDKPDVTVEYEHLLTLEREGVAEFIPQGATKKYAVAQLLQGIEPPWGADGPYLYPPFFGVEPQTKFEDAWEVFCCDILNRHEKTTDIRRRHAPEGGVDLLWCERQIAYQCKSVDSGRTGDFDVGKAVTSIQAAQTKQAETGWKQYVVCTNVDLTGPQEKKLREAAADVDLKLLTPSFWIPRCHEQWRHVQGRFRHRPEETGARRSRIHDTRPHG